MHGRYTRIPTRHRLSGLSQDNAHFTPTNSDAYTHVIKITSPTKKTIVQELCESRGGRPELSVLTSLLVSVDVKNY